LTAAKNLNSPLKVIAIVGSGQCSENESCLAEEVGMEIARQGAALVCGGLGGVMRAACRGAKMAGGLTIGILPGNDRTKANPYVDIRIATDLGHARNFSVVQSADAVIAVDGEYGTLSEIAIALKSGIPVIGLNTWSLSKAGQADESIVRAKSAAEAVGIALNLLSKPKRKRINEN
jgi:uncharacterized protein (TIGR00725 family)